ncbi:MAG: penicillin-binding protein 2 [Nocardioides sp.]|nr:penicillin-binding protein 2 [Nocardioides sp.]
MNKPIRRMALVSMALFLGLLLNATYLQYWTADDLNARADNKRVRDAEFSRERGAILVNGRPIAESVAVDGQYEFLREYAQPVKYAPITGYYSYTYGRSGVEQTENTILSGSDPRLFVTRVIDMLGNQQPKGGSVSLTLNRRAQDAAWEGLQALGQGTKGAVVAIEPASGKILAMATSPSYDPNRLASHDFRQVQQAWGDLADDGARPMANRAAQELFPPGSTFKLVTAAAALESGQYQPGSTVPGGFSLDLPQTTNTLPNDGGGNCGGDRITLTQAMQTSCNVTFGHLGLELGPEAIAEQAEAFGFGERPFEELPAVATSDFPTGDATDGPLAAYAAIGQGSVRTSPLQMALVTAGIANGGDVMQPYLVDEVRSPDLDVLDKTEPTALRSGAVSPSVARDLTRMLVATVDSGTATAAQIPGVEVAGKTGTAQSGDGPPFAWFVSFAPANDSRVAVAVMIEDANIARTDIAGGRLAAPIAKAVMEAVLR